MTMPIPETMRSFYRACIDEELVDCTTPTLITILLFIKRHKHNLAEWTESVEIDKDIEERES